MGIALAWMVAEPVDTPETGTVAVVVFCGKNTVAGTVATDGLLELRLTVRPPAGADADKFRVRFCVVGPTIVAFCGRKLTFAVTCTP